MRSKNKRPADVLSPESNSVPKAVIFSLAGPSVSDAERSLFKKTDPLGFILFKRNCENPEQLRALTDSLRDITGRDCPILIDQEGGRVQRLCPPHWPQYPAMGALKTEREITDTAAAIAADLIFAGVDVSCAPVLDVLCPQTHEIIGDRAFSSDPAEVYAKGRAVCKALLEAGITPVIKHIPGHGRAAADSHLDLPVVDTNMKELEKTDFLPFLKIAEEDFAPHLWAMSAHVIYTAIDPALPASISPTVTCLIRKNLKFGGFLIGDDLSMKALDTHGNLADRVRKTLAAGADAALYCAGRLEEMEEIADATPPLRPESMERYERSRIRRRPAPAATARA